MVIGLAMLDKGKHFPQSYARVLFSVLGIHQDGQLLITIDPWDERRARELMQEELMLRLYSARKRRLLSGRLWLARAVATRDL